MEQIAWIRGQAGEAQHVGRGVEIFDGEEHGRAVGVDAHAGGANTVDQIAESDLLIASEPVDAGAGREIGNVAIEISAEAEGRIRGFDREFAARSNSQRDAGRRLENSRSEAKRANEGPQNTQIDTLHDSGAVVKQVPEVMFPEELQHRNTDRRALTERTCKMYPSGRDSVLATTCYHRGLYYGDCPG